MDRKLLLSATLAAALGLASPAPAQESDGDDALHGRMVELFGKVELRLRQIDELLFGAAAGESRIEGAPQGSLVSVLEASAARSREVIEGIDKILELAKSHTHPGGGT